MTLSLKNWFVLFLILKTINGLQLDYLGIKNKESAEIKEKEELIFSCLSDDNNIEKVSFIYPENNFHAGLSVNEILKNDKTKKTYRKLNATYADSGWYGCSDDEGNTKHIFIWVKSMEHLFVTDKFEVTNEIEFHSQLVIPCIPTSQSYDVQLFTDSEEVPVGVSNGVEFDPQVGFLIRNKKYIHDPIELTCSTTMNGHTENLIYHLSSPANYTDEPKIDTNNPVVNVFKGDEVKLNCSMSFDLSKTFKPTIYWSKNNTTLKNKKLYVDRKNSKKIVELNLSNVSYNDVGEYRCNANNVDGEKGVSINITVHEFDASNINISSSQKFYVSKLNKLVILKVNILSYARAYVTWYHPEGFKINPSKSNGKYVINNNKKYSSLSINNVQISDVGNYTSKVQIPSFKGIEKIISIPLIIEGIPVVKTMDKLQNYYMQNDTAKLSCYAIGLPTPNIKWSFDDLDSLEYQDTASLKNEKNLYDKNSTLKWQVKAPGSVTCKACSADNNCTRKIFKISLVDVPNGFGIVKNEKIATTGDEFEMSCLASLDIYREVNWYDENGTKVVSNDNIFIKKNTTQMSHCSTLFIKSLPSTKKLMYTCEAKKTKNNMIERISTSVILHDELAPYFVDTNMNKSTVSYDSDTAHLIKLKCYAVGYPVPSITWLMNNKTIDNTCEYNIIHNSQELIIKNLYEKCAGKYSCHVKNRVGEKTTFQILELKKAHDNLLLISVLIIVIIVITVLLIIMCIKICIGKLKGKRSTDANLSQFLHGKLTEINPELTVTDQIECLPYDNRYEYSSDDLVLGKKLGSGAFGVVLQAEANGIGGSSDRTLVAVKMVKQMTDPSNITALANELKIMIHLGKHVNIVNLLGACTKNIAEGELYVIVEYCRYGNLHDYLKRNRNKFINQIDNDGNINRSIGRQTSDATKNYDNKLKYNDILIHRSNANLNSDNTIYGNCEGKNFNSSSDDTSMMNNSNSSSSNDDGRTYYRGDYKDKHLRPICTDDLILWSFQVARGMEYLSQRKVLHGDLAARNILLTDGNVVKICDFGLAKNIYKNGIYEKKGNTPMPIKWMALESMRDHVFSTQSDVWSFGIVLWEFFTLAGTPYPGMDGRTQYLQLSEGYRLEKPQYATQGIYELMVRCWNEIPKYRPSFSHLTSKLSNLLEEETVIHYINLNIPFLNSNKTLYESGTKDYLALMSAPDHDVVSSFDATLSPLIITIDDKAESSSLDGDYYLKPIDVKRRRELFTNQRAVITDDKTDDKINMTYYNINPFIENDKRYHEDVIELQNKNYKNDLNEQVRQYEENYTDEQTPMLGQAEKTKSALIFNPLYVKSGSASSIHSILV